MNSAPLSSVQGLAQIRHRRLAHFIYVALAAISISLLQNLYFGNWADCALLGLGFFTVSLAALLARRGQPDIASALFTLGLTGMIACIHWFNTGFYGPGMLAYPAILIFTALLCPPWIFSVQFGLIMLSLSAMVWAESQGLHHSPVQPVNLNYWIDLTIIMTTIGVTVGLIMKDFRHALKTLSNENERVLHSQKEIEFLATHDALTGLPNRVLVRDRCVHALASARRNSQLTAILFIDLDNFKTINDSLGHTAGDQLLVEMASRLLSCVRSEDTVSRLGGDEFLIVLDRLPNAASAAEVAAKVIAQLSHPLTLDQLNITATCSIGVALSASMNDDFDSLLQKADMAMYRAKAAGRNTYRFYDSGMNDSAVEHLRLESKMRMALSKSEFTLHYQPQFDLQSNQIIGAEALVRWRHPELGLVPPGKFIPVAENSGLIVEIGEWIVFEACRQAKEWQQQGLGHIVIGINLSPIQFRRGDVEKLVLAALEVNQLAAESIELELTESLLLEDSQHLKVVLQNLRSHGLSFSIDDFGTGYSNLSYLKHFEVERLKIDQSFIRRLTEDAHDEAIVSAIIQVANSLQLQVIAEGIEDEASLQRLIELGCKQGQGYHWSPALPAGEFSQFVRAHRQALPI